jgi:hypothetical protein
MKCDCRRRNPTMDGGRCVTNTCICRGSKLKCTSACHKGEPCTNKELGH